MFGRGVYSKSVFVLVATGMLIGGVADAAKEAGGRRIISLDGQWQIEQGGMDKIPTSFGHTVSVPGLVDMAKPAFEEVGKKSERRHAFWYRRTFAVDGAIPETARLMIHKAKYGMQVFLNGKLLGDHLPCFTPVVFDVKGGLRGGGRDNELIVRVGADRESRPTDLPSGWDFEKYLYIPGIYDSVELILSGPLHLINVQTVPILGDKPAVRVVTEIENKDLAEEIVLNYELRQAKTGKLVRTCRKVATVDKGSNVSVVDFRIPISGAHLWTPEDPFLYELEIKTAGDNLKTRFGMRSFRFDPKTKRAILNGKPYMMRGTNVCAYRFFEDAQRGDKPWRTEWVRRLHRKFKSMHWNSIRYCIGFPPDFWYDIADEEGFLIQDEFPIWLLGKAPENPKAEKIIPEYTEWMRQRWNHACVVIWDAQNESVTPETGKALEAVRHLDLSNRPWENGWAEPQSKTDCVESHPYLFIKAWNRGEPFRFSDIADVSGIPYLRKEQKELDVPIVINEYAWLWLNRDGTPTCLTDKVYEGLLGANSTTEQRQVLYAKYLAALTEFWRCRRECAGVMHFCGLGYSRPADKPRPEGGATSDHFIDLEKLEFEPNFEKYVRDAFAPVGLMIDFWDTEPEPGAKRSINVIAINDLYEDWKGTVRLRLMQDEKIVTEQSKPCTIKQLGTQKLLFDLTIPTQPGSYQLTAELSASGKQAVRSLRDFEVITQQQRRERLGLAYKKRVTSSSDVTVDGVTYPAKYAVDGSNATRWSSEFSDPQWIMIDLEKAVEISRVKLIWEGAYARAYSIEVSSDGKTWRQVYRTENGNGKIDEIKFEPVKARYVRTNGTERGTPFGYSLWEMQVFP